MRLLYVVQRYGREVAGGAELHCRKFAGRLVERGHHVEVITSCAVSHADWANAYPPGHDEIDGVGVWRLPVEQPKARSAFAPLNDRVNRSNERLPGHFARHWIMKQGPYLPDLARTLAERAGGYDVVIFFTYLWYPTWAGLPVAAGLAPCVLHPTAHDEPALQLRLYDTTFRHPAGFAFSTEEEARLVTRRFGMRRPFEVVGIGADFDDGASPQADPDEFRRRVGLGDRPYLLCLGRVEGGKGAVELFEFFAAYKRRNPGPLALIYVGEVVEPQPAHPDVFFTGFVDDTTRGTALAGALALTQPSWFESFSMVLTEAWAAGRPALVQGHCDVLVGQVTRSGGGLPYRGFAEFEAAVDRLVADPALGDFLGAAGHRYVERRYGWDAVLGRYERLLASVSR